MVPQICQNEKQDYGQTSQMKNGETEANIWLVESILFQYWIVQTITF